MIYSVRHFTEMRYAAPVRDARFNLRLKPVAWRGQALSDLLLTLDPPPARISDVTGPYLVTTTRAEFDRDLVQIDITSSFAVEVAAPEIAGGGPPVAALRRAALQSRDLSVLSPAPYLFSSRIAVANREIGSWAERQCPLALDGTPVLEAARTLSAALHARLAYKPGETSSTTAPHEAFEARHGVCQDFAHILIVALRWLGIPAAYASGYLRTIPPQGQPKLVGADAMHAWVDVWCGEELGWIGVDPTNDCLARESHVQIAMGRDYADVAPIDGTFVGAAPQTMKTGVDVVDLAETRSAAPL